MLRSRRRALAALTLPLALALGACDSDGGRATGLTPIATGRYVAQTFTVTRSGAAPVNVLASGGSLNIVINPDGAITGQLSLPPAAGGPTIADMSGTLVRDGNTVRFAQQNVTFVRDLVWTVAPGTLSATNQTVGGSTYTIVLAAQG
jgi:hypothetical protein